MRMLLVGAVLIASQSGAGAQDEAQRTAGQYMDCLKSRAAQLDDRTSDARTIAGAIYQACIIERTISTQAYSGLDREKSAQLMTMTRDADIDRATVVVLQHRAARR